MMGFVTVDGWRRPTFVDPAQSGLQIPRAP
jgi:hypothetical protein